MGSNIQATLVSAGQHEPVMEQQEVEIYPQVLGEDGKPLKQVLDISKPSKFLEFRLDSGESLYFEDVAPELILNEVDERYQLAYEGDKVTSMNLIEGTND